MQYFEKDPRGAHGGVRAGDRNDPHPHSEEQYHSGGSGQDNTGSTQDPNQNEDEHEGPGYGQFNENDPVPDMDDDQPPEPDTPEDDPWTDDWTSDEPGPEDADAAAVNRGRFGRRLTGRFGGRRGVGGWFFFAGNDGGRGGGPRGASGGCTDITVSVAGSFPGGAPRAGARIEVVVEGTDVDGGTAEGGALLCEGSFDIDDEGRFRGHLNCTRLAGDSQARVDVLVGAVGTRAAFTVSVSVSCR